MRHGRPLRFLGVVLGGWTAARVAVLWPAAAPVAPAPAVPARPVVPGVPATGSVIAAVVMPAPAAPPPARRAALPVMPPPPVRARAAFPVAPAPAAPPVPVLAAAAPAQDAPPAGFIPAPLRPPAAPGRSRLAGSAWAIARGGAAAPGGALGGQLGASQAGARLTYALGGARRLALSARVAAPRRGPGAEAGLGLDWRPTRLPLHLIAEQRVALDGGHGGPALLAVGGLNPTRLAAGFRLEAYAQGGAVLRGGVAQGFGDGAARLTRPVAGGGGLRLDLGVGAWGGAQRGARRLDLGPTAGLAVPVGRLAARLTLDWRARVAGGASPGSGPALSLGADF